MAGRQSEDLRRDGSPRLARSCRSRMSAHRSLSRVLHLVGLQHPCAVPFGVAPTKYSLVINLKTAKALGLTIPLPLLGLADEVIE